jgi:hypothetical protein
MVHSNHEREDAVIAQDGADNPSFAADEEKILRCLGAAVIMQWNTLPTKLQKELFDKAGSLDELLDAGSLRAQIARFLHERKDDPH